MIRTFCLAAAFAALGVTSLQAQDRTMTWLSVRGGYAMPTGAAHNSLDAGPAAGVRLAVPVTSGLAGFLSVDGARAGAKGPGDSSSLLSATLGATASLPGRATQIRPFMDAGVSLNRWDNGGTASHSDWSPGYDVAIGAYVPATPRIRFSPALRYRAFRPNYGDTKGPTVSSLSLEMGVGFRN